MATTQTFKTIILQPGESFTLPPNADLVFISEPGVLDSECAVPTDIETGFTCLRYDFSESDTETGGAGSLEDGTFESITVLGVEYTIGLSFGASIFQLRDTINEELGDLFYVFSGSKETSLDNRTDYALVARVPTFIVDSLKFKIIGTGYPAGIYVIPTVQGDCSCANDSGKEEYFCEDID